MSKPTADIVARNRRAIRAFLDGMLAGDKEQVLSGLHPDVALLLPRPSMSGTTIQGAENLAAFVVDLRKAAYADDAYATYGAFVVDETQGVVEWRLRATLARGGDYDQFYCWAFDLAEGRIIEIREYIDTRYGMDMNAEVGGQAIDTHAGA